MSVVSPAFGLGIAPVARAPKVHLRKREVPTTEKPTTSATEVVLQELFRHGATEYRRDELRRHCYRPATMSKRSVWALYELGVKLKRDGMAYNRLKIEEIRRLLSLAPQAIKRQLRMPELI